MGGESAGLRATPRGEWGIRLGKALRGLGDHSAARGSIAHGGELAPDSAGARGTPGPWRRREHGEHCTWVEYGDAGTSEMGCARGWASVSVWVQPRNPGLGASWRGTLARPKAKAPSAHQGGTRGDVVALSPQDLSSGVLGARRGQIGPSLWPSGGWRVRRAGSGGIRGRKRSPGGTRVCSEGSRV